MEVNTVPPYSVTFSFSFLGTVVSCDMSCDYHIASLSRPPLLPSTADTVVSIIWFDHCIESGTVLDHASHFLFHPLAVPIEDTVLNECVITIRLEDLKFHV